MTKTEAESTESRNWRQASGEDEQMASVWALPCNPDGAARWAAECAEERATSAPAREELHKPVASCQLPALGLSAR